MKKTKIILQYENSFKKKEEVEKKYEENEENLFEDGYVFTLAKIREKSKIKLDQSFKENLSKVKDEGDYFSFDNYINRSKVRKGNVENDTRIAEKCNVSNHQKEIKQKNKILPEKGQEVMTNNIHNVQKNFIGKPDREQIMNQWSLLEKMRNSVKGPLDYAIEEIMKENEVNRINFKFQVLVYFILTPMSVEISVYQSIIKLKTFGFNVDVLSTADESQYQDLIRVNYKSKKIKYIKKLCQILKEKHNGNPPEDFASLTKLPGIAERSAHMYLNFISDSEGYITVTSNVARVANRLGWVTTKNPNEIKKELEDIIPREHWKNVTNILDGFGLNFCGRKKASCGACLLVDSCYTRVNNLFDQESWRTFKLNKFSTSHEHHEQNSEDEEEVIYDLKDTNQVKRRKTKIN